LRCFDKELPLNIWMSNKPNRTEQKKRWKRGNSTNQRWCQARLGSNPVAVVYRLIITPVSILIKPSTIYTWKDKDKANRGKFQLFYLDCKIFKPTYNVFVCSREYIFGQNRSFYYNNIVNQKKSCVLSVVCVCVCVSIYCFFTFAYSFVMF
jgi:hypothetical protein